MLSSLRTPENSRGLIQLACLVVLAILGWITLASGLEWKNGDQESQWWVGWMEGEPLTVVFYMWEKIFASFRGHGKL